MKKLLTLFLVLVMLTSLIAGCGKSSSSQGNGTTGGQGAEDSAAVTKGASETDGQPSHIIVTYLTLGTTPKDLAKVQEAVNAITVPKINVEVEFKPIGISESMTNYSLWISSGEQVDLMMLAFQNVATYTSTGSLEPLKELISQYGQDIDALAKQYPIYGTQADGEIYGITPVAPCYGNQGSVIMRSDLVHQAGIEVKDQYTMDEMTAVFEAVKKVKPDIYPYGVLGSGLGNTSSFIFFHPIDSLGSNIDTGVLMDTSTTQIVNMFETDEYYSYLKKVQEWYKAGYILPDAATTDSLMPELMQNNVIASSGTNYTPIIYADYDSNMKVNGGATAFRLTDIYYPSTSGANSTSWVIPITSGDPAAAMKFLNLTYVDPALMNLIQWGIEGEHYAKTDKENIIAFPEGIDPTTSGYFNTLGLWGDRRSQYFWSEASTRAGNDAYTEAAMANPTKAVGYVYDTARMTNQIVAVDSVMKQYVPALETGSASNLDAVYKEFLAALKTAGIDDIIKDNQTQFDAWLASK